MKAKVFFHLAAYGVRNLLGGNTPPILGTIILTDRCNLHCKHCGVNNITGVLHPYGEIRREMKALYDEGVRILFFCGGETFLWEDGEKTLRDLVREAKEMGYPIVNVVTNGTFGLDLPEADLILLSIDGDRDNHNFIRGDTFDAILHNVSVAPRDNICIYMAVNKLNQGDIRTVADIAKNSQSIWAISFNFHTPYAGTEYLALTPEEKWACCGEIEALIKGGYPVFNLRSALPYIAKGNFPTPAASVSSARGASGRCADDAWRFRGCASSAVISSPPNTRWFFRGRSKSFLTCCAPISSTYRMNRNEIKMRKVFERSSRHADIPFPTAGHPVAPALCLHKGRG